MSLREKEEVEWREDANLSVYLEHCWGAEETQHPQDHLLYQLTPVD